MSKMGLDAYRFSISWSRLIPGMISQKVTNDIFFLCDHGVREVIILASESRLIFCINCLLFWPWSHFNTDGNGPINPKGLQYYNNLINELTSQGSFANYFCWCKVQLVLSIVNCKNWQFVKISIKYATLL